LDSAAATLTLARASAASSSAADDAELAAGVVDPAALDAAAPNENPDFVAPLVTVVPNENPLLGAAADAPVDAGAPNENPVFGAALALNENPPELAAPVDAALGANENAGAAFAPADGKPNVIPAAFTAWAWASIFSFISASFALRRSSFAAFAASSQPGCAVSQQTQIGADNAFFTMHPSHVHVAAFAPGFAPQPENAGAGEGAAAAGADADAGAGAGAVGAGAGEGAATTPPCCFFRSIGFTPYFFFSAAHRFENFNVLSTAPPALRLSTMACTSALVLLASYLP
jgi:hypothetical protein